MWNCLEQRTGAPPYPGYAYAPLRAITCLTCGTIFQGKGQRQTCSQRCQEIRAEQRYRSRYPRRQWMCRLCGNEFLTKGRGRHGYCSAACKDEHEAARRAGYRDENREQRRASDRDYLRRHPDRHKNWRRDLVVRLGVEGARQYYNNRPSQLALRAAAAERVAAGKQARERHAAIVEAARLVDAWRWHDFGADGFKIKRGQPKQLTVEQEKERKRATKRRRGQAERAALKIYREMGFVASRRDRRRIYQALKAELPTLNI